MAVPEGAVAARQPAARPVDARRAGERPLRRRFADLPRTGGSPVGAELTGRALAAGMHSVADVRIHSGPAVHPLARTLGARAFTVGRHVYLGAGVAPTTVEGRRTLLHELGHADRAARGDDGAPGRRLRRATAGQEDAAHRLAARALAEPGPEPPAAPSGTSQGEADGVVLGLEQIFAQMAATRVEGILDGTEMGDSGVAAAVTYLGTLPIEDLVDTLVALDTRGRLEQLVGGMTAGDRSTVAAAALVTMHLSTRARSSPSWGVLAAHVVASLPATDRMDLLERVLRATGRGDMVAGLREGVSALEESETFRSGEPEEVVDQGAPPTTAMAGVTIGPWNPGGQPIPFYLGNAAHVAIAAFYAGLHPGDVAFYNFTPVSTIVAAARRAGLAVSRAAATAGQLNMNPDIANVTRRHLYEIKPATLQSLGRAEALLYMAAFAAAGFPMALGGTSETGTSGTVPAPGGWYTFRSPEPGVITYNYRQPPRRRVRVPVTAPEPEPARSSKSIRQRVSEITGLTGVALTIYLIISEGSRIVFPPRNLVPVP